MIITTSNEILLKFITYVGLTFTVARSSSNLEVSTFGCPVTCAAISPFATAATLPEYLNGIPIRVGTMYRFSLSR